MIGPGKGRGLGSRRIADAFHIVSGKRNNSGGSATMDITGAIAGDYMIALVPAGASIAGGDGSWTYGANLNGIFRLATKALEAGDIAGSLSCSSEPWVFGVYRLPIDHDVRTSGPPMAGFAKAALGRVLIGLGWTNTLVTADPGFLSPWVTRQTAVQGTNGYRLVIADLMDPDDYVDGATINMSISTNGTTYGMVVELLQA